MHSARSYYVRIALFLYPAWIALYYLVGTTSNRFPAHNISLPIDGQIPFIETFVWAYILSYVFPFLPVLLVKDGHRLNVTLLSIALTNLFAYLIILNFPVTFIREHPGSSLSGTVLAYVYGMEMEPAANNFPSLHVIFALTVYFSCRRQIKSRAGSFLIFLVATLITLSTLFVKQHVFLDVVSGVICAPAGWALARYLYPNLTDTSLEPVAAFRGMARRLIPYFALYLLVLLVVTAVHYSL